VLMHSVFPSLVIASQAAPGWAGCLAIAPAHQRVSGVWVFRSTRTPVAVPFDTLGGGVSYRIVGSPTVCDPVTCHHGSD
jgi:hypothetical protein